MKYIKQIAIILSISFIGEILNHYLPLPIPASIYGIVILFVLLTAKIIKVEMIEDSANFLIEIMPIMFVPAAVGVMNSWNLISNSLVEYGLMIIITTFIVMIVTGTITQALIRKE